MGVMQLPWYLNPLVIFATIAAVAGLLDMWLYRKQAEANKAFRDDLKEEIAENLAAIVQAQLQHFEENKVDVKLMRSIDSLGKSTSEQFIAITRQLNEWRHESSADRANIRAVQHTEKERLSLLHAAVSHLREDFYRLRDRLEGGGSRTAVWPDRIRAKEEGDR